MFYLLLRRFVLLIDELTATRRQYRIVVLIIVYYLVSYKMASVMKPLCFGEKLALSSSVYCGILKSYMALVGEDILLKKVAEDDFDAFSALFNYYSSALCHFIYKFVKSPDLSDDLSQEIFIKVWENRKALAEIKTFKSYLFTLAKNHTLNFLKRASIENTAKSEILKNYVYDASPVEDALLNREYFKYLENLLKTLSPQSREVFMLCRQQNMTYDETAERLGISRNTVKKHMVRSMKSFKDILKNDLGISFTVCVIIVLFFC